MDEHFQVEPVYSRAAVSALATALQNVREHLNKSTEPHARKFRVHLDKEVRDMGLTRDDVTKLGITVGRRAWSHAGRDDALSERRGRPSKVGVQKYVDMVVKVVTENSQPTSIWLHRLAMPARAMTQSLLQMYLANSSLMRQMAWGTFHTIAKQSCPWAITARRGSDYCDHCYLFKTSIIPGISKTLQSARQRAQAILPTYYEGFDAEARDLAEKPVEHLAAFFKYTSTHNVCRVADRGHLSRCLVMLTAFTFCVDCLVHGQASIKKGSKLEVSIGFPSLVHVWHLRKAPARPS